ncbi:hypothetical protein HOC80_05545 [archaeon]|jgi:hypothetical protein|nr:hypothetical protein [archaeon]MBT4417537.1 hypothetical protein [archaeon]
MTEQLYNLWHPDPDRTNPLPHFNLEGVDIERVVQEIKLQQNNCPHQNVQRWGPSYTTRLDGSQNRFNAYICNDCGLSSTRPIR